MEEGNAWGDAATAGARIPKKYGFAKQHFAGLGARENLTFGWASGEKQEMAAGQEMLSAHFGLFPRTIPPQGKVFFM